MSWWEEGGSGVELRCEEAGGSCGGVGKREKSEGGEEAWLSLLPLMESEESLNGFAVAVVLR